LGKEEGMISERPLPGYEDLVVERDVPARMRDGMTLYADVYRPSSGRPFPVILMRNPYDKTQAETLTYHHPSWYAARGYVVVVQDTRGRWRSEGEFYPFANEAEDGHDTVEWAASLPHSDGRVGMYGFSYVGATQLQAALERPSSLVTICPDLTASQYYDGWTYNGGAFALAFNISWATYLAADDARRRGDDTATQTLNAAFLGAPNFYSQLPLGEYAPLASSAYGGYGKDSPWIPVPRLNREMTGVLATARFETSSV
jgi:putative CocE/NonD family hydrolase